jgi:hypothetical protein
MKTVKRATVMALIVFAIGFAPTAQAKDKDTYLGEYCWNIIYPLYPGYVDVMQVGVYEKEGGHFTLYGTVTMFDPTHALRGTATVSGNMEMVGDEILVAATRALTLGPDAPPRDHPRVGAGFFQATLDAVTLSGPLYDVGFGQNLDTLQVSGPWVDTATMTFTTCP